MKPKRLILSVVITVISVVNTFSQIDSRYSLSAGFGRQKIGIPLVQLLEFPAHSSFMLEALRMYGDGSKESFYQTLAISSFQNRSLGSGYNVQSNIGKSFPLGKSLRFVPEFGLGLVHRFLPKESFELVNGIYEKTKDFGSVKPFVDLRTILGYQAQALFIFVSYQLSIELLYNQDLPVLPVNYLHLGARYSLKTTGK